MKRLKYLLLVIIVLLTFFIPIIVQADQIIHGTVTASDGLSVRTGPGTNYDRIGVLRFNNTFYVIGEADNEAGCSQKWYKLTFNSRDAYVCSTFVSTTIVTPAPENEEFPESFRPAIATLEGLYPNWTFVPYYTGINFNNAVQNQNTLGKSLIQTINDGWKHLASFNYVTNRFANNYSGGGSSWFAASDETIAYYLDARNFLNERRIFMFEVLSYNPNYHTVAGVQQMLNNTFMSGKAIQTAADRNRDLTYAQIFIKAAETHNVSPYFLAARVIQEVGHNRSTIVSGTVSGFEGYYNFYNIGATGPQNQIITNGLTRAKNEGWNNEHDAIIGGASFLATSYIGRGQDTLYFQKYNVVAPPYFLHQYMQNVQAPFHESSRVYNSYRDNNLLNNNMVFRIPIYNNMPAKTELSHPGNPNNYLKELRVDGTLVAGFNPEKYSYSITTGKGSISLTGALFANTSSISGLGTVSLTNEKTTRKIVVTAQNETKREYTLTINRIDNGDLTVEELLNKVKIKHDDKYIKEIKIGQSANQLKSRFNEHSFSAVITVKDVNGQTKTTRPLATGDKVTIKNGNDEATYQVVIVGDVTGNGETGLLDLVRVRRYLLGAVNLSEIQQKAADMNGDNKVDLIDLIRIQRRILGG